MIGEVCMGFFDNINEKFFNPLSCKNRKLYFECILKLIEHSKTVPVLYEIEAKNILILYLQNSIYSIEVEDVGDISISNKLSPQENAAIILKYFRDCGWLMPIEIGRSGDNIASVSVHCRKLVDAINKIFNKDLNGAITNHIFSIYEILKSAFEKDSIRAVRPYTNVFIPLVENESDLKDELLTLRDSIRKIMEVVLKIEAANEFGQYLIKDEFLNKFFKDYFFIKKSGMIPAYIANITKMLAELRTSKLYQRIIDEYTNLVAIDRVQAKIKIDEQFDALNDFINTEYEIEINYIDHKINRYYNLYSTRMMMVLSNNINLEYELNNLLLMLKSLENEEREKALLKIAETYRLLSIKYIGRKSFERRKKINPHKRKTGLNTQEISDDEKKILTDELLVEMPDKYSLKNVKSYFNDIFVDKNYLKTSDFKINSKQDAIMLAAGVIYAGSEDFPYKIEFEKGFIETEVANISKMKFERKES